jgi:hypothetical protein
VVLASIFRNVKNTICFRLGPEDAEIMAKQMYDGTRADLEKWIAVLMGLEDFHYYLRLSVKGARSKPFLARTVRPGRPEDDAECHSDDVRHPVVTSVVIVTDTVIPPEYQGPQYFRASQAPKLPDIWKSMASRCHKDAATNSQRHEKCFSVPLAMGHGKSTAEEGETADAGDCSKKS